MKIHLEKFTANMQPSSYLCYLDSLLAAYIAYLIQDIKFLTPNKVTIFSGLAVFLAVFFLLLLDYKILFVLLIITSYTLDAVDGMLARTTDRASELGDYADQFTDYIKDYTLDIGLAYYIYFAMPVYGTFFLLFFIVYLMSKSIFYLSATSVKDKIRNFHTSKIRVITYTPAEKYLIVFPVAVFFYPLLILHFILTFFAYSGFGIKINHDKIKTLTADG